MGPSVAEFAIEDGIAVLTLDSPPVNALSAAVRGAILEGVLKAEADPAARALVLICAGKTFVAGADISEFGKPPAPPALADVLAAVENASKPVVAAIHGTALGGGLELALACHCRIAAPSAKLGLPEVKLGLIPGGGGTQRLPRAIGVEAALKLIVEGEPISAEAALDLGLIAALAPEKRLRTAAVGVAKRLAETPPQRTRGLPIGPFAPDAFETARRTAAKAKRGFDAPPAAIAAVEAATRLPFEAGLAEERRLFEALRDGPQSAALRHLFFAERQAGKVPGLEGAPAEPVARVGVVGAGVMGGGIALAFAQAGLSVTVVEADAGALERGLSRIESTLQRAVASGRLSADQAARRLVLIEGGPDLSALADADLVVEAIVEDMEAKTALFRRLDAALRPGALIATNTSYLDVDALAAATAHPERVLGLHFFSPAQVMRLVEVVRAKRTSPQALATAMALVRRLGKIGVVSGVCHGFVANRMQAQRQRQANRLIVEGAAPADVDRVLSGFGFPMGPFAMLDMAGLDIGWRPGKPAETVRDVLCEMGRKGQKTGAGFYDYGEDRKPRPSPVVEQAIVDFAARERIERRPVDDQEILDRCLMAMVNEGAKILEEGIALRASDIDVAWVYGFGWPAWRGGPMYYADSLGAGAVLGLMKRLQARHGRDFAPSRLLERLADEGGRFSDL